MKIVIQANDNERRLRLSFGLNYIMLSDEEALQLASELRRGAESLRPRTIEWRTFAEFDVARTP